MNIATVALSACALVLFMFGGAFAAVDEETAGSICMILACASSVAAMVVGQRGAP